MAASVGDIRRDKSLERGRQEGLLRRDLDGCRASVALACDGSNVSLGSSKRWTEEPTQDRWPTGRLASASKLSRFPIGSARQILGSRPAIEALTAVGYLYFPYRPDLEHWFCKPSPAFRTHHLHLIPVDSPHWAGHLVFRDQLRRHPSVAAEYAALKQRLAEQHRFNREAYTDAKGPFIASVLKAAAPPWR